MAPHDQDPRESLYWPNANNTINALLLFIVLPRVGGETLSRWKDSVQSFIINQRQSGDPWQGAKQLIYSLSVVPGMPGLCTRIFSELRGI